MSDLRHRLRLRERLLGSFIIELPVRAVIEAYAVSGYDFVVLDLEHSATDFERLSMLIACCRSEGIGSIVRIRAGGSADLTRVLDMHPDGVMVPGITTTAEVETLVKLARFHPVGQRGLAPIVRHRLRDGGTLAAIDARTALIVQIEEIRGVENAHSIAGVVGVDAVFVGPYDLSQALGIPGSLQNPALLATGARIAEAVVSVAALGVYVGDASAAEAWQTLGASFFTHGTDGQLFAEACRLARASWPPEAPTRAE